MSSTIPHQPDHHQKSHPLAQIVNTQRATHQQSQKDANHQSKYSTGLGQCASAVHGSIEHSLCCSKMENNEWAQLIYSVRQNGDAIRSLQHLVGHTSQVNYEISNQELYERSEDGSILAIIGSKADRSEIDKVMRLSSLLAIEFQLIKKRFGAFQQDFSQVSKEVTSLSHAQRAFYSMTESRQESFEESHDQQMPGLLRAEDESKVSVNYFQPLTQRGARTVRQCELEDRLNKLTERVLEVQQGKVNSEFTAIAHGQRIEHIEDMVSNWKEYMMKVTQLHQQNQLIEQELECLLERQKEFCESTKQINQKNIRLEFEQLKNDFQSSIEDMCQQVTSQMVEGFSKCASHAKVQHLKLQLAESKQLNEQQIMEFSDKFGRTIRSQEMRVKRIEDKQQIQENKLQSRVKKQELSSSFSEHFSRQIVPLVKGTEENIAREITSFKKQQQMLNEVLCAENILARWVWESGQLKGGNLVAWDKEATNTLPQNFTYLPGQHCLLVASSGVYKVELGFYARKKPTIQIIVNGQAIVSAVNNNSYVLHHSSGKLKDLINSQISGLTYQNFLTLPASSHISIAYQGQTGHGFISLQRL